MSRAINFRAWNNDNNDWLNENDADLLTIHLDGTYEIDRGWVVIYPDLTLEQDTGLKDKNGKKIFEGDILKGKMGIFEVRWFNEIACYWFKPNTKMKWHPNFDQGTVDFMKIIGNIHENPDLLNTK